MTNTGKGLELFVCELYKDLGYMAVERDYRISKSNGTETARGQIDLTYKRFFIRRYVECKYRTDSTVTFDDYAKFETTLKTFNIPTIFGEIVTNTYFDEKVKLRAKETGITLIDKEGLVKLNNKRNSGINISLTLYRMIKMFEQKGLTHTIDYVMLRNSTIERQIAYHESH